MFQRVGKDWKPEVEGMKSGSGTGVPGMSRDNGKQLPPSFKLASRQEGQGKRRRRRAKENAGAQGDGGQAMKRVAAISAVLLALALSGCSPAPSARPGPRTSQGLEVPMAAGPIEIRDIAASGRLDKTLETEGKRWW